MTAHSNCKCISSISFVTILHYVKYLQFLNYSLTNTKQWRVASWTPSYEPADSKNDSEQQLSAEMRANMKRCQHELGPVGPAKRGTDLTDDRQIQGNWIDSSHKCAHPILQELHLRVLIKLDPMTRVNPGKDTLNPKVA